MSAKSAQIAAMRERGFITVGEAHKLAHVARSTVYRWIDANKLVAEETGLGTFVQRASLIAHLGPVACKALKIK